MYSLLKTANKSLMTSIIGLSIWIAAILINAFADMAYMGVIQGGGEGLETFGFILLFSAIFSLSGIIIFWLVFLFNNENENLFSILLITAIVTPAVSVLLLLLFFGGGLERDLVWFIVIAVLSGFVSTVLHYNAINAVLNKQQ